MRVFKYLNKLGIDIFENTRLKISQISDLNDPFELRMNVIDIINRDQIRKDIRIKSVQDDLYEKFVEIGIYNKPRHNFAKWLVDNFDALAEDAIYGFKNHAIESMDYVYENQNKTFGMVCFTRRPNNLLMWSHYTEGHTGFVVEFDLENNSFVGETSSLQQVIVPVDYSRDLIVFPAAFNSTDPEQWKAINRSLKTKSIEWKYEKEIRTFHKLDEKSKIVRDGKDFHYEEIRPSVVRQVVFGSKMDEVLKKKLKEILYSEKWIHVGIKQGSLSHTHYKVNYSTLRTVTET